MVKVKASIIAEPSPESVRVSELIGLVPDEMIDQFATDLEVDKWVKKLKGSGLFKLILFSILQGERLSLRVMQDNTSDPLFKILAPALAADEVTWGGIRDRLIHVKSEFFRRLYEKVYQRAEAKYGSKGLSTHHIKRFDSTMVCTFSRLLSGMQVGNTSKGKTQVKFTTELKDDFLIHMAFHQEQAYLSEETALKEAVVDRANKNKGEISVFDKGLKSRQSFADFDAQQTLFVGRVHEKPRHKFLHTHTPHDTRPEEERDELEFIQDSAVKLYESNQKICHTKFRLIQYRIKKTGQTISFVTNVWDLEAATIAQVYKMRWDIEVLFRFMKQEMNLTHFVCNDANAIEVMLYCTLIASMLVLIYKKKNEIKSYKRAKIYFFKELLYEIILEMLEIPEATQYLKQIIQQFVKKQ